MEEVEVAPADGDRAIFPCYCWLTEGKGDKKIERDVLPGQPRPPRPSECNYDNCSSRPVETGCCMALPIPSIEETILVS